MNITNNERAVIEAICNSAYGDGPTDMIWLWEVSDNCGISGRALSGVVSSLVQKGLATSMEYERGPDGITISLTDAGLQWAVSEKIWNE